MRFAKPFFSLSLISVGVPALVGAELQPATLKAWEEYVRSAEGQIQTRVDSGRPFLWTDEAKERRERVQKGEIVVAPVAGHGTLSVPGGLIHDWIGAVFIPNATTEGLYRVLHDYNRYKETYQPVVTDSRTLSCTEETQEFSMVWQRHVLFVNGAMEARYLARDITVDAAHGYNVADATRVQEIEGYGRANQRVLPPDTGKGFIWRLHGIARYEQTAGGVYLELEAMALTRDIPASLAWLVDPVVNHLSVNSLATTLRQTRQAVSRIPANPESTVLCPPRSRQTETASTNAE